MNIYWKYFKYIVEHKKNVFKTCWRRGLYLHAFTHDLSKFSPQEFIPYAQYFYGDREKYKLAFEKAWEHHHTFNPHHWNHWYHDGICREIPVRYILQMICDWEAMGVKFGNTAQEYYLKNKDNIKLHSSSRNILEDILFE